MKKLIIASLLIAGLATAGLGWAHGNGGYGMMHRGYGMMDYSNGMMGHGMMGSGMMGGGYGAYNCPLAVGFDGDDFDSSQQQKFLDDTTDLRKQINDKRFNYMEAQRNPATTRGDLAKMEKEIYDLQSQLRDKAAQYK